MKQRWSDPGLSDPDRLSLCKQLRQMISSLRQLQHESGDMFIGMSRNGRGWYPSRLTAASQGLLTADHYSIEYSTTARRLDLSLISKNSTAGLDGYHNDS
jgi:hypothetical protein